MAITTIMKKIKLDKKWIDVDLGNFNDFYLITIKEKADKKDTVKPEDILKVRFEIAIDSGIKDSPLSIQYINVDFNEMTSNDEALNKRTAFRKNMNFPSQFYIRAISFETKTGTVTAGETSILLNINCMKLN